MLLFRLTLTGRLQGTEAEAPAAASVRGDLANPGLLARAAIACLIIGFGLLNVANAQWAHAVGVTSLFAFIVTAFLAIVPPALTSDGSVTPPQSSDEG